MHALKRRVATGRSSSLKRQAGIDLIQLSVAVGIIAFILSVGFLVVPTVMTNIKVNSETSDVQQSVSNALRVFGTGMDSTGLNTATAINLRLSPPDRINGTTILNRFGGQVDWTAGTLFGNNDGIVITSTGYTAEACAKLVPNVQALFGRIKVGTVAVKDLPAGTNINMVALATNCAAATATTPAKLEFTFAR
ncbi:hypothetical protein CXB49_11930 [Chromobacterium sp. ATCC 53434]|uniref:type 4 pilus major pilin n=1 Tax=Chromobacterium TaxID=535 RepID=UPI000C76D398|nr:type 4 pilus major pilin [Chromobacterium sp. ATCC 53434]AUH51476.1 hypothetical protein CXB49_11930 [Chromobacterium sp. ATCC 53434]